MTKQRVGPETIRQYLCRLKYEQNMDVNDLRSTDQTDRQLMQHLCQHVMPDIQQTRGRLTDSRHLSTET